MAKPSKAGIDPRDIFQHAVRFHWTNERIRRAKIPKGHEKTVFLLSGAPAMVLNALASELYLKCLCCIDRGEVPEGHDLEALYNQLPQLRRASIEAIWDHSIRQRSKTIDHRDRALGVAIPRDLPTALHECRLSFLDLRYQYEDPARVRFYIEELPAILRAVILVIQPTWSTIWGPL